MSTRGNAPPVDLRTALFRGLAPDGGLYIPETFSPLPAGIVRGLRGGALHDTAVVVGRHLFGESVDHDVLGDALRNALDFPIPLRELEHGRYVLELFHGPTAAFKDVAARVMAQLMVQLREGLDRTLTVLTATSGDTGGAVAHAFFGLAGTQVVVLYPRGRVSPLQERQFTTLGGNVLAVAVEGSFDDCQHLAQSALTDERLRGTRELTSANSINVGRLLPQVLYYAHAWVQLPTVERDTVIAVPSGNFGNLTAGLIAKRIGIPLGRFIAATNVNDVVPEFLRTGALRPRPAIRTLSSAMDVGNPSNVARIRALYGNDLEQIRRDVVGCSIDDDATRASIRDVHNRLGYILDPHSAVGYAALRRATTAHSSSIGLLLATAHPSKFAETVEPVINQAVDAPRGLASRPNREPQAVEIGPHLSELRGLLL